MGCCGRGNGSTPAATYPKKIILPDGSEATVTSAADERVTRERYRQAERQKARTAGYTAQRR